MASSSSSSRTWKYDVFPSFSGEDVRKSFLSHLLKKLHRKSINTFIDNDIKRSLAIAPELLSAITNSMISIVVFSKKYASSTWCLNELIEIHKCYKELTQIVIPVFYEVNPSDVRKQTGEFGEYFKETCLGKTEGLKQRWIQALEEVACIAGHDSNNWPNEANMVEHIANDVINKLITPSNCYGDLVGIEDHLKEMNLILCLESDEEARMVGILGPSGIGKTTIARILFSQLSSQFHHHIFCSYKRTNEDNYGMKLRWEEQFLSEILDQKDIKISQLGVVKQRLKHKKVLIVLDDVDNLEILKSLVGQTGWFGPGSRIIVTTQDRKLLKSHKIDHVYEVEFPSRKLALRILCQSAFGQNSPLGGYKQLANEVVELVGNLPLALNIIGSSLKGREKEEWMEMLPDLRNSLDGEILKTLRVSYDRLDGNYQEIFLYIACLLNCCGVNYIISVLGDTANFGLKILAEKSLIHISPLSKTVEMHSLLQKLGKMIVRDESFYNPGKRRFLLDAEDIFDVFTDTTGTETVLGISLNTSKINGPLSIDENSFQGMLNLRYLKISEEWTEWWRESGESQLSLPQGLASLPRKLRILYWDKCPLKCIPSNFKAEFLVELKMVYSKLERLWEGTQKLRSLKYMDMSDSENLKEIPDLTYAINLEEMDLSSCKSLVTLPSSIRSLKKLRVLNMRSCSNLEFLPTDVNLESMDRLDLQECSQLRSFPQISRNISLLYLGRTAITDVESSLWIENMSRLTRLDWDFCPLMTSLPSNFRPEYLDYLSLRHNKLEKLWEGAHVLGNLLEIELSESVNLKEFPDLSMATNLEKLCLDGCKSLVTVPSSIQSLGKLTELKMERCIRLEAFPMDVNLESLCTLNLSGCSQLKTFPQISRSIECLFLDGCKSLVTVPSSLQSLSKLRMLKMEQCICLEALPTDVNLESLNSLYLSGCSQLKTFPHISRNIECLYLDETAIEEVPSWIEDFSDLTTLTMRGCKRLRNISTNICKLRCLQVVNFSDCERLTSFDDASVMRRIQRTIDDLTTLFADAVFPLAVFLSCGLLVKFLLICENIYKSLRGISHFFSNPEAHLNFDNCFALDRDAETLILDSDYEYAVLPGGKVPKYFMHQDCGSSVSIPLPECYLSEEFVGLKACIVLEPPTDPKFNASWVGVLCYFRDKRVVRKLHFHRDLNKMDHLLIFNFRFPTKDIIECPSELDTDDIEVYFYYHMYEGSYTETSPYSVQKIKGCGIEFWDVLPRVLTQKEIDSHLQFSSDTDEDEDEDEDEDTYIFREFGNKAELRVEAVRFRV